MWDWIYITEGNKLYTKEKKLKRQVFVGFIAFTAIMMCSILAFADELTWELENNVLTVSGTGEMESYTINNPAPWNDRKEEIYEVVIENGVSSMGQYAFYYCEKLNKITIPDTVTKIDAHVFDDDNPAVDVYINDINSWLKIDFEKTTSNPLICGGNLYENNKLIKELVIPPNITTIKKFAFCGYVALEKIYMYDSVTAIEGWAFYNCSALKNVYYEGTEQQWNAVNVVSSGNTKLETAVKNFGYELPIDIEAVCDNGNIKILIHGIKQEAYVMCAHYKQDKMICADMSVYNGEDDVLFTECEDSDSTKIFVLADLENIMPLCSEVRL